MYMHVYIAGRFRLLEQMVRLPLVGDVRELEAACVSSHEKHRRLESVFSEKLSGAGQVSWMRHLGTHRIGAGVCFISTRPTVGRWMSMGRCR